MTLPEFCLRRPVFAAVLNLLIVVVGLAALSRLPVRELPDIDAAAATIRADYPGAAPAVVDSQVTQVLEAAAAGLPGVRAINSGSERGDARVRVRFEAGMEVDDAVNDLRASIARLARRLPDGVENVRVSKNDDDADPILRLSITSDHMSAAEITDFAERFVIDRLGAIDGVAQASIAGGRRYAMRIALDPEAMAARRIAVTDVTDALRANNVELPAGVVDGVWRRFTLRADARLSEPEDFASVTLRVEDAAPVRLADVATVSIGVEDDDARVRKNGRTAVGLRVLRQSRSNTIAIADAVRAEIEALRPTLPEGMEIVVTSDDSVFIESAIRNVAKTLLVATALVVAVIFLFLGSPRATLVPAATIPVALIGAVTGVHALGYSLNILTLFALILAIGIVVDDSIVVLEAIQRRIADGADPVSAAALGSREVMFAVIATSVTLISVFTPISFLDGRLGRLFTEFGITLAVAVGVSTVVALTLSPALCRVLLRTGSGGVAERAILAGTRRLERGYRRALAVALDWPLVIGALALAAAGAGWGLFQELPRDLAPREDRGVFFVPVRAPQGATPDFVDREVRAVEAALAPLVESGEAQSILSIVSAWDAHRAFVVVRLADWESGRRPAAEIVASIRGSVAATPGARAFPVLPAGLGVRGSNNPLQLKVMGPDFETARAAAEAMRDRLAAESSLRDVEMAYDPTQPELRIDLDRALADDLGVSLLDAGAALQAFFAAREVSTYVERGREYPVILEARAEARRAATGLAQVFLRSRSTGALIPLAALARVSERASAPELDRYDRMPAIGVSAGLADDGDLGAAVAAARAVASEVLPPGARIAFDGPAREFVEGEGGALTAFLFALVVVYLVLAAQFESFFDPVAIMLTAPLAATGALAALWATDGSVSVYTQIGGLLLLGLMAKDGILIVEYANQLRDRGASVREAALEGAVRRLRPILMTVLSTLLGAAPLVLSSGAGAEAREAIGVVILGGFGLAALPTLFLTPVLYDRLARLTPPRAASAAAVEAALRGPAE